MSNIHSPTPDESTQKTFGIIQQTFGFVPNVFRAQTLRPDLIDAEVQLIGTTMVKQGALTRQQKEYMFLS